MKKILFVIFLAMVILLGVYGCSVSPSPTVNTNPVTSMDSVQDTEPPETTEETLPWRPLRGSTYKAQSYQPDELEYDPNNILSFNRQVLPETVENPDDLPVLKWVCVVSAGKRVWNEAAVVELNQMLADRNLPYRVQFTILSSNRYIETWEEWYNHPDVKKEMEDADLIYGYYSYKEMEEWLLPITDHIYGDAQPALAGAMPDPLSWFNYEANGEIYGIPKQATIGRCQGWSVDTDFMEKYDLTVEDFNRDFWEMDELFAEIYEKNGNQPFLYDEFYGCYGGQFGQGAVKTWVPMPTAFDNSTYQGICMCFSIDLQAEKPTVVNVLETELFSKVHDAALRYLNAGYTTVDDYAISYTSFISATEPYQYEWLGRESYDIPCTPIGMQSLSYANMTGISKNSAYQEQALSILEQIVTDDSLRLQLCFGKEGRDYTLEEGNVYSLITQEDGSCYYMDFLSPQALFFGFTAADDDTGRLVSSTSGGGIKEREGMTQMESYKEHLAQASFSYCPAVFDYSVLDDELQALDIVLKDYYPMFCDTENYTEEYYQELLEKMEEAGMSTVIAELQRQLDAWIAEHPDWDPLS